MTMGKLSLNPSAQVAGGVMGREAGLSIEFCALSPMLKLSELIIPITLTDWGAP